VEAIVRHAQEHAPPGVVVTADTFGDRVTPYLMDTDHPGNEAVRVVLAELYGREPYYTRLGGTIGFVSMMKDMMGVDTLMFGFTLGDEQLHAPNEFYRLDSFDKCQQGYCMLLHELRH
jgi:acetylornithine deacetylase/succinyl-diaminopimelate desuccinylase-like protein